MVVFHVSTSSRENSDHVVRVGSFEETYNIVNEKGEIDILGGISYTDERAQNMLFFRYAYGGKRNITSIRNELFTPLTCKNIYGILF